MLLYILLGTIFGCVLSRSGAADYNYIQRMFLFEDFPLYGIIGSAVVLNCSWSMAHQAPRPHGVRRPLQIEMKSRNRGNVAGGLLFGVGWSMAGMCPGPIFVNIGEGKIADSATHRPADRLGF